MSTRSIPRPMKCCQIPEGKEEEYLTEMIKRNGFVYASVKMDGYRCRSFYNYPWSSTGKIIKNRYIRQQFLETKLPDGLDGELVVDPFNFQSTQSGVTTYEGEPQFTFWVFDLVDSQIFQDRIGDYMHICSSQPFLWLAPIEQNPCFSIEEIFVLEHRILQQGHEGLIIKSPNSLYKNGRVSLSTYDQVKLVRFHYDEASVIGFEEGEINMNEMTLDRCGLAKRSSHQDGKIPNGSLGSLRVVGLSGEHRNKHFNIGTMDGITHEQRQYIWNNQDEFINKRLRYRWKVCGTDNLPRHPVFISWL